MPEIETDNAAKRILGAVMATLTPRELTIPANRNATADYNANQVDLPRYNEDDADSIRTEIADYIAPLKLLLTGALVAVGAGNNKEWPSWAHSVKDNPGLALALISAIRWLSRSELTGWSMRE
jgi:hypothetical protein